QAVDACRQERHDGGWNSERTIAGDDPTVSLAPQLPFVDEHRNELLNEERMSRSRADDPSAEGRRRGGAVKQPIDDQLALGVGERLKLQANEALLLDAPIRMVVEELVPG